MGKEIDFEKIEKKWQKKWNDEKVFEVKVDKKKDKYFYTTPYPYISGSLHIGHGRAVTESDIFCRYKRMKGFNVLFPMAFHITGTPVLGISSAIEAGDKDKIKLYEKYVSVYEKNKNKIIEIVKSFIDPQKIVNFFLPKMIKEYSQLGLSVDWSSTFTSGDFEHQQLVAWQFNKYKDKKYLVKGSYPVLYSIEDQNAVGEDDIIDGDTDSVEKQEFTLLKFKFKDKFLVAATLRPETIYGQTNLWINPNVIYHVALVDDEKWILTKEAVEKLSYQSKKIKYIGEIKEKLIGEYVLAPGINKEIIILPSEFVDSDVGTGIVTSVPSDAPYDYLALKLIKKNKKLLNEFPEIKNIKVIPIIETKKYGNEAGVKVIEDIDVKNLNDSLVEKLTKDVYKEGFHSGRLNNNCGEYNGMRVIEAKEKIKKKLIERKEADVFYETSRKAKSRSRGKVIVAVLDDQWFLNFNAKGWKELAYNVLKMIEILPEKFRKQFEDTFKWLDKRPCARKRGLGTKLPLDEDWIIESLSDSTLYMVLYTIQNIIKREKFKRENLNQSFFDFVFLTKGDIKDASRKTGISENILSEIRESFEYWMPNDQRHTFPLHLSNHLSFMLFSYAAIFSKKYWPRKISFHGLVQSEGTKMSKSKGNVISLPYVNSNYGSDVFRFYMTSSSNIEGIFDWKEKEALNAKKTIEKLYLHIKECILKRKKELVGSELYESKFERIIKSATEKINEMKLREYNNLVVYDMLNLVREAKLNLKKQELYSLYNTIVEKWVKLISPVCPHVAEELWEKLGNKGFVSIEKWPEANESKIKPELERAEEMVKKTIEDINNVIKIVKDRGRENSEKVYVYVLPNEVENFDSEILGKRLGLEVKVFSVADKSKYDPEGKSKKAKPGKPGIYLE